MKIFAYAMTYDTGFAPCVTNGTLTLACCKTNLRYKVGNLFSETEEELYLLGLCGKTLAKKCKFKEEYFYAPVYAARITDVCKATEYYSFHQKTRCDQVYVYNSEKEEWKIGEKNPHHLNCDKKEWDWQTEKDLVYLPRANSKKGVLNSILVSTDFAYLGEEIRSLHSTSSPVFKKIAEKCTKAPRSDHREFDLHEKEEILFKKWFCENRERCKEAHFLESFPEMKADKRSCRR